MAHDTSHDPTAPGEPVAFSPENETKFGAILQRYPNQRAALIPALHLAQEQFGWLSAPVLSYVASRLELPESKVLQVASFYTMFDKQPVGRYKLEVCTSIPCCMMGGYGVVRHLCQRLGIEPGETTPDGRFTLLEAECLAGCGHAPLMQVNGEFHENLTETAIDELLRRLP
jgi:NADH-quinone oxidoreductase subunit E